MQDESFEVVFIEGIEDDFVEYKISEEQIFKIKNKIDSLSSNIFSLSQKLVGFPNNLRKIRFGDYRLFVYIENFTIYCLAFIHRKECYKKESLNRIFTLVKNLK